MRFDRHDRLTSLHDTPYHASHLMQRLLIRCCAVVAALALAACATAPSAPAASTPATAPPAAPAPPLSPSPPAAAATAVDDAPSATVELPPASDADTTPASEPEPPANRATGGDPDSINNATIVLRSEYTDLWERLRRGFSLPELDVAQVTKAEEWYSTRPDYIARMVERSRRYLYHIVSEVEKRGMPAEIALLPMIESAYNPMAMSSGRASGIWQFIPSTGKFFGMKQNWWFDERRDVVAATEGALDYLDKLHAEFNDWYLALAAYNWGEGSVRRAIAYNAKRGLPIDYLNLKMPAETRDYVPKLQAVKNIVRDPARYNLTLADIPDAPYFTAVRTSRKMDVTAAAELAEMTLDDFLSLNPQHNRPVIAGADETTILLPYDKAELFASKLELSDQPMVTWQAYSLKSGENLADVAARFRLSLETLKTVNGIGSNARVPVGHALLVPTQAPSTATAETLQHTVFTTVPNTGRTVYHRVRKGESLQTIARRYGVAPADIRGWNPSLGRKLVVGQRLTLVSDHAGLKAKRGKDRTSGRRSVGRGKATAKAISSSPRASYGHRQGLR